MSKICLLDKTYHSFDKTTEELLKTLLVESKEKIGCGDQFQYKGKFYTVESSRPKEDIAVCREFKYEDKTDYCNEGEITCPYCGLPKMDSWECGESEEREICDVCGSIFSWEREVEVTYYSKPIQKNELKELTPQGQEVSHE